ncbi:MAG: hypothetical protein CSA81_11920 [Acidobacteria bacterium]|nr:MAG: hypothetical protein CSA81_11920 [Acidobacteriota bacterium]
MGLFFRKTKALERDIDQFLDQIVQGALAFVEGINSYLDNNETTFERHLKRLNKMEGQADKMRRRIETDLYVHTLIPDSRGDVLGLMESSDKVLNILSETLAQFSVESPDILPELQDNYKQLARLSCQSVEQMVLAIRAYFRDLPAVRDAVAKVLFYEKEADQTAEEIKRIVFKTDLPLSHKFHHRYFALHIESISDEAENVCDRLSIASIKRDL